MNRAAQIEAELEQIGDRLQAIAIELLPLHRKVRSFDEMMNSYDNAPRQAALEDEQHTLLKKRAALEAEARRLPKSVRPDA